MIVGSERKDKSFLFTFITFQIDDAGFLYR